MVIAGIVAGGVGSRMGHSVAPKQFLEIGNRPVIIHTIEKFLVSEDVDYVVVGVHADWQDYLQDLIRKYIPDASRITVTPGGANRNETIQRIIDQADALWSIDDDTIFLTHDAVRPFVTLEIIKENVNMARAHGVCDTVISATDTIVRADNNTYITDIPQRSQMYQGQTPQSFRYGLFKEVYSAMTPEELEQATDACKIFFMQGHPVYLVEGSVSNFKITYPFDLKMANSMLEANE